jgi:hypothetical protein
MSQLHSWARALGGVVSGGQVLCPGPGHSANDRSLSVKPGRDGDILVHSHAGDDAMTCKDFARSKLGLPAFKPNSHKARPPRPPPRKPEGLDFTIGERITMDETISLDDWEDVRAMIERQRAEKMEPFNPADLGYFPPGEPWPNGPDARAPRLDLRVFNPADWEGKKAPPRRWDVPDYIPHGAVALLYADGGTGMGYLGLQLAVARAVAKEWIGLMLEPGRTLVLSTEDDLQEMWRRIEGMLPFYGASMKDLADIRLVNLVGENSVLGLLSKGIIEPTPMYQAIDTFIAEFKMGLDSLEIHASAAGVVPAG